MNRIFRRDVGRRASQASLQQRLSNANLPLMPLSNGEPTSCPKKPQTGKPLQAEIPSVCIVSSPPGRRRSFAPSSMPDAMAKWLPPHGFTCKVHHLDAESRRHVPDVVHQLHDKSTAIRSAARYLEIVPNERIRYTDRFDDPNLPGVIEVDRDSRGFPCGTEINIEQANLPAVIPVEVVLSRLAAIAQPAPGAGGAGNYRIVAQQLPTHPEGRAPSRGVSTDGSGQCPRWFETRRRRRTSLGS